MHDKDSESKSFINTMNIHVRNSPFIINLKLKISV